MDFACGQGAAVNCFQTIGFNFCGVDISEKDIGIVEGRYLLRHHRSSVCPIDPPTTYTYGRVLRYRVISAVQSFCYLPKSFFENVLEIRKSQLETGESFTQP